LSNEHGGVDPGGKAGEYRLGLKKKSRDRVQLCKSLNVAYGGGKAEEKTALTRQFHGDGKMDGPPEGDLKNRGELKKMFVEMTEWGGVKIQREEKKIRPSQIKKKRKRGGERGEAQAPSQAEG